MSETADLAPRLDARWIAGLAAVAAVRPSQRLFQEIGRRILPASTRRMGAHMAEQVASQVGALAPASVQAMVRVADASAAEAGILGAASRVATASTARVAITRGAVRSAAATAAREVGVAAGRAAVLGFLLDGGIATFDAVRRVRRGEITRNVAARRVAKEAFAGAVATGAGVLAVSAVVALTGGLGAPAAFFLGAGASVSTKHLALRLMG